jgi:histidinol phosphatase-like enzyme
MEEFEVSADATCYIGDKLTDIEAANAAGVRPILVGQRAEVSASLQAERFVDLSAAADALISEVAEAR